MDFAPAPFTKSEDYGLLSPEEPDDESSMVATNELDRLINMCKENKTKMFTFILAMGNAADAVEIMCVGYILSEMDDATTQNKGISFQTVHCNIQ